MAAWDPARLLDVFRADVETGKLPQVPYIVAPEAYAEHPNWAPDLGAWYMSQFLDILASHPEVFSKTVLFVNYDEGGGHRSECEARHQHRTFRLEALCA